MKSLLQKTFENEFYDSNYRDLILNLFNSFDFSKKCSLKQYFTEDEKQKIKDFTYLGTHEDTEKKSLDVLIVELKSSSKVERARSLQRNLIGKYLKTNLKDSALVAFYSKDNPDWGLSFVKMDYRLDERGVKVEIGTPPKRYSFLVGKTEPSHTAQKQLMPLLDDRKSPTLDEIEKSFSIEKVTKEFYTEIAKKFTELVGGERKIGSKKIVEEGQLKYPKPSDTLRKEFTVRLIGRLMFCWFLKKKKSEGGVPLIPNVLLSSDAISQYPDYYHSLLEPLFFQVLNTPVEKRNKSVSHSFWNNVPFLNGGLFEPHLYDYHEIYYESGLSKYINTLKVPDSWFLDLFKIFEIYNFTIDESTSTDIDISVDPEMLGRIFENLLAEINPETGETARKSTGSYYTPRPIVEYMVDESLKQYLKTQLDSLRHSELVSESKEMLNQVQHERIISRHSALDAESSLPSLDSPVKPENDKQEIDKKLFRLLSYGDYEGELTEQEKDAIIDALDRAKIIDPACGSGAFPMGILHKMLLILQKIDPESKQWLSRKLARIDNEILRKELEKKLKTENWDYVHKLGIIQNSIYGVDIQPIAVEISKLRFFLSLIVDEKIDDDKPNRGVVPLPNLEFKFVAANSLIGLPQYEKETTIDFSEADHKIEELKKLREDYFTSIGEEKHKIEEEFLEKQKEMLEQVINWQKKHKKSKDSQALKLSEWNPFSDEASSWFAPEWMFGVKDGFDIVIANPPYVRHETIKELKPAIKKEFGDFYCGTADIYTYFYKKGIDLLKAAGHLCFIAPNKFMRAGYGKNTRKMLATQVTPKVVIDFCDLPIFDATTYPSIVLVEKTANLPSPPFTKVGNRSNPPLEKGDGGGFSNNFFAATFTSANQLERLQETLSNIGFTMPVSSLREEVWNLERPEVLALMEKLRKAGKPLGEYVQGRFYRGIVTGMNEAFVIDNNERANLIAEDVKNNDVIKPYLQGRDIKKWRAANNHQYILYIPWHFNIKDYPAILRHLKKHKEQLERRSPTEAGRYEWYALQRYAADYYEEFEKPKIVWGNLAMEPKFAYDSSLSYISAPANIIPTTDLYLLAILNSPLCKWWISLQAAVRSGGFLEYKPMYVGTVPVVTASDTQKARIVECVQKILSEPHSPDVSRLEAEIIKLVYDLYGLTSKEIEIVEERR
ncbi:MAG: TaqI-like C-terminal specificity domain-containing protein [Nitrospirota bacterium]